MNQKEFKQRPLIGVVSSHGDGIFKINQRYLHSLWKVGGLGVVLEYTEDPEMLAEYAAIFDGFLFSGGVDVNPTHYGEEKQFDSVEVDDRRDGFEKALFETVYPTGKPIFGICRGIQSINVWLGGTLHQHLDGHRQTVPGEERTHSVQVKEGTLFHRLCGQSAVTVNTFHHQAIKTLSPVLTADGVSEDGYVEIVHEEGHPFLLAVQFHPEFYCGARGDDHSFAMFSAFIQACRGE